MITFDDARAVAAASPSVQQMFGNVIVADYGWQNDDVFLVVAENADGLPVFDAPSLLVDKQSGELTEIYGLLGNDPVPDLVPVGTPPA